jgi:dolichol-phosphate mannosyltransferase
LSEQADLSVIIPTYNESENILHLIEALKGKVPDYLLTEIIIVDDNSPDGTGRLIENYIKNELSAAGSHIEQLGQEDSKGFTNNSRKCLVKLLRRQNKMDLISAVLQGIKYSTGHYILVMDADFSHPPESVPSLINELICEPNCIVVASRYIKGGAILGWPYRRIVVSSMAVKIARYGLQLLNTKDPMSGFFAFPRHIIESIQINSSGYKLLLEILVKARGVRVKEVPYTFVDRRSGTSKIDISVMLDYLRAVWHLYRYGLKDTHKGEKRGSVLFLSKAARFYTVGISGLFLNYVTSIMLTKGISNFSYIQASIIAIILSITSNFFLNKIWTFEDRNFSSKNTLKQYGMFLGLSTLGAAIQMILLYSFVQSGFQYTGSLVLAVAAASVSNFLLNKKWTFREKIWG